MTPRASGPCRSGTPHPTSPHASAGNCDAHLRAFTSTPARIQAPARHIRAEPTVSRFPPDTSPRHRAATQHNAAPTSPHASAEWQRPSPRPLQPHQGAHPERRGARRGYTGGTEPTPFPLFARRSTMPLLHITSHFSGNGDAILARRLPACAGGTEMTAFRLTRPDGFSSGWSAARRPFPGASRFGQNCGVHPRASTAVPAHARRLGRRSPRYPQGRTEPTVSRFPPDMIPKASGRNAAQRRSHIASRFGGMAASLPAPSTAAPRRASRRARRLPRRRGFRAPGRPDRRRARALAAW